LTFEDQAFTNSFLFGYLWESNLCLVAILLLQSAPEVFELFFGFSVRGLLIASLFMLANALNPELQAAQKGE
jgi:hypothetical protein